LRRTRGGNIGVGWRHLLEEVVADIDTVVAAVGTVGGDGSGCGDWHDPRDYQRGLDRALAGVEDRTRCPWLRAVVKRRRGQGREEEEEEEEEGR